MRRLVRFWSGLSLRWKLVLLNGAIIAVAGVTVLMLVHHVNVASVDVIMQGAATAPTPAMAQGVYNNAVDHQVIPALVIAALVAVILNFAVITLALRPLGATRAATRRIASGDLSVRVASRRRDEIGDVARSVDEMAVQLERLEALRRRSTDDLAHELRTPLHNLVGLVEAMRDGVITADVTALDKVSAEVSRLTALVDDLRRLADAQMARDCLEREEVGLATVCREVLVGFDAALAAHDLTARVVTSDGGDPRVLADRGRIAQVLGNLVTNAMRYARTGTSIDVEVRGSGSTAHVAVVDEGEEIPAQSIPFIFERFVRVDPSRGRDRGGAGIGLAIVRELVEAHGGRVGAESGGGSVRVWFELPLAGVAVPAAAVQRHLPASARSGVTR